MSTAAPAVTTTADDKKWKMIDARIRRRGNSPDALIEVLHAVQEAFGYLEPDVLAYVGNALGVPPSRVYGVATFYSLFMLKPQGEHTVIVCTGTACYINHAAALLEPDSRPVGHKAGRDERGRPGVAAERPLPGRLQHGACGRGRRRSPGQGDS